MSPAHDLRPYIGTRRKVRITRGRPSQAILNAFVLAASPRLALLHPFDDFEPDGFAIIRTMDVTDIRSDGHERHWESMLKAEGLLGALDAPSPKIGLSSMQRALQSAAARSRFIAIHCEDDIEPIQDYYFALVMKVTRLAAHVRYVDAQGIWAEEVAAIPLQEITMIEFDTPYLNRFSKYIRNTST